MNKFAALLLCAAVALPCAASAAPKTFFPHKYSHVPAPAAKAAMERGERLEEEGKREEALAAYFEAVEADPDYIEPHDRLTWFDTQAFNAARQDKALQAKAEQVRKTIRDRYAEWERRYPEALGILYWFGTTYQWEGDPRGRAYLQKIIVREPTLAVVQATLAEDYELAGEYQAAADHMRKATELDPQHAMFAARYALALQMVSWEQAYVVTFDVARRFPAEDRAAQALYWLGARAGSDAKSIPIWQRQLELFPVEKFRWSDSAASILFETWLRTDPPQAVKFARDMHSNTPDLAKWAPRLARAESMIEADKLLAAGRGKEALALMDKLTPERASPNAEMLNRLKARVLDAAGQSQQAYDSLMQRQIRSPEDATLAIMESVGENLGKSKERVRADIRAALGAAAKPAPAFDLKRYASDTNVSLEKLRGKVVFVTFWYAQCGPCREEFPHFEKVLEKFKGRDVVYLGINGLREDDLKVETFMKRGGVSFIALKGEDAITGESGFKVVGYPTNFLIDREGRIVYANFRTGADEASQRSLARMIESLL